MKTILTTTFLVSSLFSIAVYSNYYSYSHASSRVQATGSMHDLPRFIAPGEKKFIFSPRLRMWAAYDAGGKRVAYGIANGGSHYCGDLGRACRTPIGSFRVHSKGGPECVSSRFPLPHGGAAMPYCMHFRGGYAIHGSPQISNVNGSHGCVRVKTEAARWLSSNFMQHGTKVVVLPY